MSLEVTKEAADWYINELELKSGDYLRFYVKLYGGIPTVHPNYSLGLSIGKEGEPIVSDMVNGVTFYFNEKDSWFLDEFDLKVVLEKGEAEFIFSKKNEKQ